MSDTMLGNWEMATLYLREDIGRWYISAIVLKRYWWKHSYSERYEFVGSGIDWKTQTGPPMNKQLIQKLNALVSCYAPKIAMDAVRTAA